MICLLLKDVVILKYFVVIVRRSWYLVFFVLCVIYLCVMNVLMYIMLLCEVLVIELWIWENLSCEIMKICYGVWCCVFISLKRKELWSIFVMIVMFLYVIYVILLFNICIVLLIFMRLLVSRSWSFGKWVLNLRRRYDWWNLVYIMLNIVWWRYMSRLIIWRRMW